jgi:predicted tellurium resistance membrane protein TerC
MLQFFQPPDGLILLFSNFSLLAADPRAPGTPTGWVAMGVALVALTVMEIVLGIDNIVFLSIVTGKLPPDQQKRARFIGLSLALIMRIILLMLIQHIVGMTAPLLQIDHWLPFLSHWLSGEDAKEINDVSWRDIILFSGGLFLIYKSVIEIDHHIVGEDEDAPKLKPMSFTSAIIQIILLDMIFSLDSIITAVGMVNDLPIMIAAVVVAVIVMMFFAGKISRFIDRNPTIKMLALTFLLMIGMMLVAEGFGTHINKGYIYFAMAFSLIVELLNLGAKSKAAKRKATATPGG